MNLVPSRAIRWLAVVIAPTALAIGSARAQHSGGADAPSRLGRLDAQTAAIVGTLLDSARAAGLPTDPLVGVALEGANRRAASDRIVEAVREYLGALRGARSGLGAGASEAELVSGAGAVLSGVSASTLRALRGARPRGSLTVPLVVLADLIARGVPIDTASASVIVATRAGVPDADLATLRRFVERDITAGTPPVAALTARLRNVPGVGPLRPNAPAPSRPPGSASPERRPK